MIGTGDRKVTPALLARVVRLITRLGGNGHNGGRIAVGCAVLAVGLLVLVGRSSHPPVEASVRFEGFTNGGRTALLRLTNHTSRYLMCGPRCIECKTAKGWVRYEESIETIVRTKLPPALNTNESCVLTRAVPQTQSVWRVVLVCSLEPPDPPSVLRRLFQPLLSRIGWGLSDGGFTIWTDEIPRCPIQSIDEKMSRKVERTPYHK
jgi:hypothetical protein